MKALWNSTSKMVVGGALALAIAAGAAAQAAAPVAPSAPEPPKAGEFDKPLKKARVKGTQGQSTSNFTYIQQDGDQSLKVTMKDGQVEAEVNGKPVPAERIKREGDTVTITDENGKTIGAPIHVGSNPFGELAPRMLIEGQNGGIAFARPGEVLGVAGNPPPVMLGITMSEADEGVLKHLGVEGSAIQIDTVRDGLPAAAAGLKPEDLVVSINGQSPATSQKLREILRGSKAGDELKLHVIRRGQAQDITVKLEAYDAAKLGNPIAGAEAPNGRAFTFDTLPNLPTVPGWRNFNSEELNKELQEARAQIEEALKNVKESAKFDSDKIRQEVSEALEKAMESLSEQREKLSKEHEGLMRRWNVYTSPEGQSGRSRALVAPEQGLVLTVPQTEQSNKKVEELEDRLSRMEKMLDAISKKLDEKK